MLAAVDHSRFDGVILYQLELPFNRIELDKMLSLAPNPKRVDNYWATQGCASSGIVERLADQFKGSAYFSGHRFHKATYVPIISAILANLLNANAHKLQVIYSRDTDGSNRPWISVWDFLAGLQFVNTVIGGKNESGVQSWAVALPELIDLLHQDKARIVFDDHKASIEVRDADKNVLPVPERRTDNLQYNRVEKATAAHNQQWLTHTVTLDKKPIVPFVKRKFNDSLEYGGRFYGGFQRIPSKDRARLKIDGQPTVELDYSAIHLAILYAWEGVQLDYAQAYTLEGYERATVKAITLRMLNIESVAVLKRAITLSANPANQGKYKAYKTARSIHDLMRAKGLSSTAPHKPKWVGTFIDNIPSTTNTHDLINAFLERHSAITKHIGSQSIGLRLQAADSQIMALVLDTLRIDNVPALPVHDSIIIQKKHKAKAKMIMQNTFKQVTGFHAQIK